MFSKLRKAFYEEESRVRVQEKKHNDHEVDNLHLLVHEWGLTTWFEREKKVVMNEYYILKSSPKYYFFEKVQISLSNNMMRGFI